jgi:hypothetical protein
MAVPAIANKNNKDNRMSNERLFLFNFTTASLG